MSFETFGQPLLTFPDAEKSPLSIRAKALVFVDPRSRQLREDLEQLATRSVSVLIRGETGTGKELLARHIHRASDRGGLFVSVNCGAISPTYADAELFGYAAGSYSGSASSRAGWFGSANGGIAEQFGIGVGRADRTAIDRNEQAAAVTGAMDVASEQFFTRTGLATDQYRGRARRQLLQLFT